MGRTSAYTPEQKRTIKQEIWDGATDQDIADRWEASTSMASAIKGARMFGDVEWPDGSTGKFPEHRKQLLSNQRRFNSNSAKVLGSKHPPVNQLYLKPKKLRIDEDLMLNDPELYATLKEEATSKGYATIFDQCVAEEEERDRLKQEADELKRQKELQALSDYNRERARMKAAGLLKDDRPKPEPNPALWDKWDWPHVLDVAADLMQVAEAELNEDEDMKLALGVVLKAIPESSWRNPTTKTVDILCADFLKKLNKYRSDEKTLAD